MKEAADMSRSELCFSLGFYQGRSNRAVDMLRYFNATCVSLQAAFKTGDEGEVLALILKMQNESKLELEWLEANKLDAIIK